MLGAIVVLCLASTAAIRQSDGLRVIAKWLVDPLFHSTSDGGVVFLLLGSAALALTLAVTRHSRSALWNKPDPGLVLLGIIGFALGLGVLMFFEYVEVLDLPWQLQTYHWAGASNTFNTLLHSHIGKTALSTLVMAIAGGSGHGEYDTGGVLLQHVPPIERWALALLFVAACVLTLASAPSIARRYAWHPIALALYGFAALNCLKAIVDGGALTYRLPPSLLMLALLVCARDRDHLRVLVRRHGLPAVALLGAYVAGWITLSPDSASGTLAGFITLIVVYALGLLCWAYREQARNSVRNFAVAAGLGYLALGWLQEGTNGVGMLLQAIPQGTQVVVVDPVDLAPRDASSVVAGQTPLAIYRRFGDDPLKPSRVLIRIPDERAVKAGSATNPSANDRQGADDGPATPGREFAFAVRVVDARNAARSGSQAAHEGPGDAGVRSSLYLLLGATRTAERTNTAVFLFRTASAQIPPFFATEPSELSRNNFYVHLHLVAATLRRQGLEEYVLMPLLRVRDRDLFVPAGARPPAG